MQRIRTSITYRMIRYSHPHSQVCILAEDDFGCIDRPTSDVISPSRKDGLSGGLISLGKLASVLGCLQTPPLQTCDLTFDAGPSHLTFFVSYIHLNIMRTRLDLRVMHDTLEPMQAQGCDTTILRLTIAPLCFRDCQEYICSDLVARSQLVRFTLLMLRRTTPRLCI